MKNLRIKSLNGFIFPHISKDYLNYIFLFILIYEKGDEYYDLTHPPTCKIVYWKILVS